MIHILRFIVGLVSVSLLVLFVYYFNVVMPVIGILSVMYFVYWLGVIVCDPFIGGKDYWS